MARRGALIKGGAYLEALGGLRALAVDKTETITEGKPRVLSTLSLNGTSETDILRIPAAIDTHSSHPLAEAVVRRAHETGVAFDPADHYQARTGRGPKLFFSPLPCLGALASG